VNPVISATLLCLLQVPGNRIGYTAALGILGAVYFVFRSPGAP